METLSGGGTASGPLSFMRGFDAFAGVIKSGGKTRRAAKMVILNVDHPDIVDFIECKVKEEAKAWTLMQAGYDGSGPDSEAYSSIFFQNANNSVRVTDEFMHAVERDGDLHHPHRQGRRAGQEYKARDLMHKIAEATWQCGDPGMQYDTTINRWHTSKNTGRINASNPCSEYMFLDDSACNLASFNLMKFLTPGGQFDIEAYRHAIDVVITAHGDPRRQRRLPHRADRARTRTTTARSASATPTSARCSWPSACPTTPTPAATSPPALTAILCGDAYSSPRASPNNCPALGAATPLTQQTADRPSPGRSLPRLLRQPRALPRRHPHAPRRGQQHRQVSRNPMHRALRRPAARRAHRRQRDCWDGALAHGEKHGYRNSQVTVLAPTGTIGFMMDCDTTGIEPDLALVKYKKLVGGGMIKIVNNTVPAALFKLGYKDAEVERHRQLHRRHRHHRRRARHQARAPRRLRLLLQARQGHALHLTTWATSR
jgi:ribonucleoside-diphosphate reductase alpha chain